MSLPSSISPVLPPSAGLPISPVSVPTSSERLHYWVLVAGRFASVQVIVQALSFLSGVLIIRSMAQKEYAYYTIANTMQGTMNLLSDMGISIAVLALGGKVWSDRQRLGEVVATALRLRYWLAAGSILVISPVLLLLLLQQGTGWVYALTILGIVLAALLPQLTTAVLSVAPRLHSQFGRLQKLDLFTAALRFVLISLGCWLWINSSIALIIAALVTVAQYFFLRHWTADVVDLQASAQMATRAEMLRIIRNQAPNAIFFCFQGQISIWLISVFGNTQGVAEVGALGRLAMLFSVIGSVMGGIIVPRFARCQNVEILWQRYRQILGICCLLGATLVMAALLFAPQFLWLLGKQYAHLRPEFLLMVFSAVLGFFASTLWSLNSARAWIEYSWLYIPATIVTQGITLAVVDVSTVRGVILIGLYSHAPTLLLNFFLAWRGFRTESCRILARATLPC